MRHMLADNVALIVDRITKDEPSALVANIPVAHKAATRYDISYTYPLRISGLENLASDFRTFLDARYEHRYTPEEILGFIYAVLHAPAYRTRYAEFLRIDFPRIPFPETAKDFDALSALGQELIDVHLLRETPRLGLAGFDGKGDYTVEKIGYSEQDEAVSINGSQRFRPVPKAVWEFHIGGYPVLEKYLKSRKGRTLSLDEIDHVRDVANALAFTMVQMAKIDAAYKQALAD